MSVKIRLKRMGKKKHPFYRIVVADSRRARDGRFIEILGYYDPMKEPALVKVDEDKVWEWMDKGARPSENVENIFRHEGIMERWQLHREGVKVTEMDAIIEERRKKQPAPKTKAQREMEKEEKKKAAEAEAAEADEAAEAAQKAAEVTEETAGANEEPAEEPKAEEKPEEEDKGEDKPEEAEAEEKAEAEETGEDAEPEGDEDSVEKKEEEGSAQEEAPEEEGKK